MNRVASAQTYVERMAAWSQALNLDAVPGEVKEAAKRSIVDFVGVAIAGSAHPSSKRIREYARQTYTAGCSTLLGVPNRLSPIGASLVNGASGHVLDFDDTSYTGIMHGSTVVFPAALAAAELAGADGRRLLEAFIAGSEVTYAVASLCTEAHYYKGWWSTATFGVFGAAAAAAKALALSELQTTFAVSLAGVQACGLKAAFGTDAKSFLAGRASAIGVEAALLASFGHTGPSNLLEDRRGFIQVLNDGVVNNTAMDVLGKEWRLVNPGIFLKQYPVCSAAHAAVELTQHLVEKNQLKAEDIQKVVCEVPPLVHLSLVYDRPVNLQEAQFSMPFAIGTMLARCHLGIEHLKNEALSDPKLQKEMSKVEMHRVDALQNAQGPECARVTLVTTEGRYITGYLDVPLGMPTNPMSDEQMREKFMRCTAYGGLLQEESKKLFTCLTTIESAPPGSMVPDF